MPNSTVENRVPTAGITLATSLALGMVVATGLAAWVAGIASRFFDYDEVYHAHAVWLIARGEVPYHDFLACHPPFAWYALAGLMPLLPDSPQVLFPLRAIAAVGIVVWLWAMLANARVGRPELPVAWLLLGACLVLFSRPVLDYALEFRPDSWSYALLFVALLLFRTERPAAETRRYALYSFLASLAVLSSLKPLFVAVFFSTLDFAFRLRERKPLGAPVRGHLIGIGAACGLSIAGLWLVGIDPRLAFAFTVEYQVNFMRHASFGHGLLAAVLANPLLVTVTALGVLAWLGFLLRSAKQPNPYELALILSLLVQLVVVERPYKQYFGPWFLFGTGFFACVGALLPPPPRPAAVAALSTGIVVAGIAAWLSFADLVRARGAAAAQEFYSLAVGLTADNARIVAWPPFHPIVRHDVFYGWNRIYDPGGHTTEPVMRDLALPGFSARFELEHYRRELAANPPALIVAPVAEAVAYEPDQTRAIEEYLANAGDRYVLVQRRHLPPVWIDREQAPPAALAAFRGPAGASAGR